MTKRFVARVERAEIYAVEDGKEFATLGLAEQDRFFDRAKEELSECVDRERSCTPDPRLAGNPTVEVEVVLGSGAKGRSRAFRRVDREFEAVELRDGDERSYRGKSVLTAVRNVETEIATAVAGLDAEDSEGSTLH